MTNRPLVQAFARVRISAALLRNDLAANASMANLADTAAVQASMDRLQQSLAELEREVLAVAAHREAGT